MDTPQLPTQIREKDLVPNDTILGALPVSGLEGERVVIESPAGTFSLYQYLKGAWRQTNPTSRFRDWRYPDSPLASANTTVGQQVTSGSGYTVPTGKRLYVTSAKFAAIIRFEVDGCTVAYPYSGVEYWQGRPGVAANSLSFANPVIVGAGSVLKSTDAVSYVEFIGFLVSSPSTDITPKTQNIDSSSKYTVPAGKMFVLLNAWTNDTVSLKVTPSGGSAIGLGKNFNSMGNGGGWALTQPWFFYPGDVIESDSATSTNATINGYEIAL